VRYTLILGLVLFGVWLLWSGHFVPLLIGFGVASVVCVLLIVRRMGLLDEESVPAAITLRAALYVPWLAVQVVKSNLDVARRVLSPGLPIAPRMIRVPAEQRSDLGLAIFANSITLTPGTVSVELEDGRILVHALSAEAADDLLSGEMGRRVRGVEGGD
jgi:multicomponent Na+:H+ antiporter subunit E